MAILTDWPWRNWASAQPMAPALIDDSGIWTWQQLATHLEQLASGFVRQGVKPGMGVALRGKNSTDMLCCYLALLQCGARLLPLNPQLPDTLLDALLPSLNIEYGLCLGEHRWPQSVRPLSQPVPSADTVPLLPWAVQRLATMTLTSGSSGMPKAAVHTYDAHLVSAEGVTALMAFSAGDRWLLSLPLFHVSGQGVVWRWLVAGASLVLRPNQPLDVALRVCTHASLVPTQLWRLLSQSHAPVSLRAVLLGGAAIPAGLTQQAEARGIRCWCGYGMTELGSTVCAKRADAHAGVGLPLAGREIKLDGEEILLRGPCLAEGYWRDGRLIPLTDAQGWFHTRDRGQWDGREWQILGRLDNQFFSGGEGIQPEDVEAVLLQHPDVTYACVVPIDDPEFGQRPVAVVEVENGLPLSQLIAWWQPRLAGFQRPVACYLLPAELNSGGIKISRQQVKNWVEQQPRCTV
ncbi:o-succinylbenzoate--CoA ligase [Dickeya sp. CFBP 2040]|uniref:O-succinylbenzoate--CoA ligase n=1 Tax=Dickeya poaceiphila TaxID=568768 RepID=A0A5B8I8M1_9GAMM|nr:MULTISPECIES: o-succinylbenzoate--CoA ligase [Dickeya]NKI75496.1 o-succinylbenzoate--CoA ligase [Dickeya sp. CFBP 2040]QDX30734.1 o-succinylbenzoate--CoA ligase [Dickeya poaceiphila]